MEGEENRKKKPLDLNWDEVITSQDDDDDEPPQIVILKTEPSSPPSPTSSTVTSVTDQPQRAEFERLTDHELEENLQRQKNNVQKLWRTLRDNGAKLKEIIKRLEEERERRRVTMDVDECETPTETITSSGIKDTSNGSRRGTASSQVLPKSTFNHIFSKKLEENTDCKVISASDKESSTLHCCDHHKMRYNGEFSQKLRQKGRSSSRQRQSQGPSSRSSSGDKNVFSNGDQKGRTSSIYSFYDSGPSLSSCIAEKKGALQVPTLHDSRRRKRQTVVLVDEDEDDEPELLETTEPATEQFNKLPECLKEATIYYPSRDHPESVEICYKELDCLAPEAYLRSPVMNFYIQYIQQRATPSNRAECDYHFFSTYFYKKLEQAVSYKGSVKDSYFVKFRRWWKGVNIFQKAYVLIPIHEDLHWSLVIICIPDKEEESGPIILHLDSLGLHCSRSVFSNIKRYIGKEWNYLNQEVAPSDLPIADKVWKQLPRRIDEKTIAVPQQKNDYDCGLFVLYFMERFIEEAPERLKKKDLAMFGKQWFKPEEASGLRVKIRNILRKEFQNACISESSPLSSGGAPA